jgi:hypothetical protein
MPQNPVIRAMLSRPLDPTVWQSLSPAEQARLRFSLMRGLAWTSWDKRPAWWWTADHRTLLELKLCCALEAPCAGSSSWPGLS